MKFILIADDRTVKLFFPLWEVIFFAIITSIVLYLLHPHHLLEQVLQQDKPSPVALSYLKAFRKNNEQNPQFMVALIEQEIGMNQLNQAQLDIAFLQKLEPNPGPEHISQIQWLNYLMLRSKAFKTKLNTPERIGYLKNLRSMSDDLLKSPLQLSQFKRLAQDNLALGRADVALAIYNNLFDNHQLTTAVDLADGGNIAMQNNAQRNSSKFYWAAYHAATTINDKKNYAMQAIKALWAGNYVNDAVALANQLPSDMLHDRETLLYLAHLALAANQPKIAERYTLQALLLSTKDKHE